MKKKLVVFHPAIAPYRIDFFNTLNKEFDATFYFEFGDVLEQSFKQNELQKRLEFVPHFLAPGFCGIKNLRLQVFSILRKEKPSVVFCSEYNILGLLLLLYKLLFNWHMSILTICDDSRDIASAASLTKRVMRYLAVKCYDGIILTNDDVLAWYQEHFHRMDKFLFFPIIQEDQHFRQSLEKALPVSQSIMQRLNLGGKKIILFVGRLIDIKNLFCLLDAFSMIAKENPNAVLLFVGEGDQQEELKEKVRQKGLTQRVSFVGKQQGLDLYAYYNLGQIFVLPSYYERFGAVVNEALIAGCYTLCSSAAGASCLIKSEEEGLVFDPLSTENLAENLSLALNRNGELTTVRVKENKMNQSYDQYMVVLLNQINGIVN